MLLNCTIMTYIIMLLLYTGAVIEGPSNVIYFPGRTPLPIELTCNVTGLAAWIVNDMTFTISQLASGRLPGHNRSASNILVNSPVNNTEYICVSQLIHSDINSDPAYIYVAGKYDVCLILICVIVYIQLSTCIYFWYHAETESLYQ